MTRTQRLAYRLLQAVAALHTVFVVDCTRRWGKTFFAAMLVHMEAMKGANRIIRYVAPTKLHGRQFVIPAFAWLHAQLPERDRPRFLAQDNTWLWPNGSRCHLGSAETMGDVEAQVGTACHLALLDEAGKIRSDLLRHLVRSVLRAQFLTTGGNIVIASTPALTPAHYLTQLVAEAEANGAMCRYTIDDCDHVPVHERERMIVDLGGRMSTEVRRELYCEHVPEKSRLIIPEWMDVEGDCIIDVTGEKRTPNYRDWYASGDFGFEDLSVVLYAWFDFEHQDIVIEHEVVGHRISSLEVGLECKKVEQAHQIVPVMRVADAPLQLLSDMAHPTLGPGIVFTPAMKDDSDVSLAQLRNQVQTRHIKVHPRCVTLISHLRYGIWNERRSTFERSDGFGHWDAIDALKYLNRAVNRRRNPVPTFGSTTSANSYTRTRTTFQSQRTTLGRKAA
jgi:hypothetical protein